MTRSDDEMSVIEAVSVDGEVTLRFFGGARLTLQLSPEHARMFRRLMPDRRGIRPNARSPLDRAMPASDRERHTFVARRKISTS